jgi:Cu+-exporting ATPase
VDAHERNIAIGLWAGMASGGMALGPLIAGLLLERYWWGSVFLINVPVVAVALVLTVWLVPRRVAPGGAAWDLMGSLQILVGLTSLVFAIKESGIETAALAAEAESLRRDGATAIFVAVDGEAAVTIAIAEPIKPTTPAAIEALHREGIRIVMLTGDNRTTAEAVARRLGIDEVEADVLPDRKSDVVQRLRKEGRVVAMAGDGVNDAPALATADVGIAMGTGTDVAIESAGVTLLGGDLTGIVRARRLSRATMRNIRQNLFFAFVQCPRRPWRRASLRSSRPCSPMIAAAAVAVSVSVIANALPARRSFLRNAAGPAETTVRARHGPLRRRPRGTLVLTLP